MQLLIRAGTTNYFQKYLKYLHIFVTLHQGWYNGYNVADAPARTRQWERRAGSQVCCCCLYDHPSHVRSWSLSFCLFPSPFLFGKSLQLHVLSFCRNFKHSLLTSASLYSASIARLKRSIINPIGDFPEFLKKCDTLPR